MWNSVLRRPTGLFLDVSAVEDRNIRLLYAEVALASILGAVVSFNAAFAIRLGASREVIALLSALPPLIMALTSIPFARFIQSRQNRKGWLLLSLLLARAGYVVVALIPLVVPVNPGVWLVAWLILLTFPTALFTSGFQALLADLVSERRRAFVFSRRSILWSIGVVVTAALAGFWLDRVEFPHNYQWMYLFGFLIALGSNFCLSRLKVPTRTSLAPAPGTPASRAPVRLTRPFKRLIVNMGVYNFGLALVGPLFVIYYIEVLNASDGWLGLNNAAGPLGVIFGYLIWERLLRRHTFIWALKRAMLLTWVFPVGVALFPDLTIILFLNFLVNLAHPGVELTSFNTILKLSHPEQRTVYLGWYNAVMNGSLFISPLVGVWLAGVIGIPATMLLSGALRLLGGLLMHANRVDMSAEPEPTAA